MVCALLTVDHGGGSSGGRLADSMGMGICFQLPKQRARAQTANDEVANAADAEA